MMLQRVTYSFDLVSVVTAKHLLSCCTISWIQYETLKIIFHKKQSHRLSNCQARVKKAVVPSDFQHMRRLYVRLSWRLNNIALFENGLEHRPKQERFSSGSSGQLGLMGFNYPTSCWGSPFTISEPSNTFLKLQIQTICIYVWSLYVGSGAKDRSNMHLAPSLIVSASLALFRIRCPAASNTWKARSTHSHPTHQHIKHAIICLQMSMLFFNLQNNFLWEKSPVTQHASTIYWTICVVFPLCTEGVIRIWTYFHVFTSCNLTDRIPFNEEAGLDSECTTFKGDVWDMRAD